MSKFLDAIETVRTWVVGDRRSEVERRTSKSKRKKNSKRRAVRRKKA
jgi:3'-phosphoadenosine 5'-phosphosulfate sulfotransferase (PAPS reductase)/FAD synthetase